MSFRLSKGSGNKYGAVKVEVDGIKFDSKREAKRYQDLRILERAGRIESLELKPRYELVVNGVKIGRYTADFRYLEARKLVVEDSKGDASRDYPLRKKLMLALHGIEIRES